MKSRSIHIILKQRSETMDKTILEQLKAYFLEMDQKRKQNRLQSNLKYAIENLDVETAKELIESGASVELIEKEESTLGMAAHTYTSRLFQIVDQYRKQKHIKSDVYLEQINNLGKKELEPELNAQMEEATRNLLTMSELLYQHGANINHNTYLGLKDSGTLMDIFSEKKEIMKVPTVFAKMAEGVIWLSKDMSVLEWIASKPDFDITKLEDSNIISSFLYAGCPESVQALQLVLEKGLQIESTDVYGVEYNALIECLAHQELNNRQEKFHLLWQHAKQEQRDYVMENFDLSSIEISTNFGENTQDSSGYGTMGK